MAYAIRNPLPVGLSPYFNSVPSSTKSIKPTPYRLNPYEPIRKECMSLAQEVEEVFLKTAQERIRMRGRKLQYLEVLDLNGKAFTELAVRMQSLFEKWEALPFFRRFKAQRKDIDFIQAAHTIRQAAKDKLSLGFGEKIQTLVDNTFLGCR